MILPVKQLLEDVVNQKNQDLVPVQLRLLDVCYLSSDITDHRIGTEPAMWALVGFMDQFCTYYLLLARSTHY